MSVQGEGARYGRLETGGGWRRTCLWRERRWPSFIIWRWAGPAQGGWIHCPRNPPLLLLPRRHRHPSTSMSLRRHGEARARAPHEPRPGGSRPAGRRSGRARSLLAKAPKRAPAEPPGKGPNRPSGEPRSRLARVPGVRPARAAAGPARGRALGGPPRASGPRREVAVEAGGGSPARRPG
jgi:hypothetical protein